MNSFFLPSMIIIKKLIRNALGMLGYDIVRLPELTQPHDLLVNQLIDRKISVVMDVGANVGQFAKKLRHFGYRGRIVSFEPVSVSFAQLKARADADPLWEAVNLALGAYSGQTDINVSRNFVSSSIRDLENKTLVAEPSVEYFYSECINVEPLDGILSRFVTLEDRPFLKVDVQGYENEVFEGAQRTLSRFDGVILESSLSSLYKGEWLFSQVMDFFSSRGFILAGIEHEFIDPRTGELLQVNVLFWNTGRTAKPSTTSAESPIVSEMR